MSGGPATSSISKPGGSVKVWPFTLTVCGFFAAGAGSESVPSRHPSPASRTTIVRAARRMFISSIHRGLQDRPQPVGDDALLAVLQHEHRDENPLVSGAAHAANYDGRIALRQLLRHLFAGDDYPLLVP